MRISTCATLLLTVCCAALVTGCDRADEPSNAQPSHFPLNVGWVWRYQVKSNVANEKTKEHYTVHNRGLLRWVDGSNALVRSDSRGNHYLLRVDDTGVTRLASRDQIATKWQPDPGQPKRFVLRNPLSIGTYWQVDTISYLVGATADMPREKAGSKRLLMGFEIAETDASINVPAGEFNNCLLVIGNATLRVYADGIKGYRDVPVTQREWFCPNAGLVRLERTETVNTPQYRGGHTTFELMSITR